MSVATSLMQSMAAKNPSVQKFASFVNNFSKLKQNPQEAVQRLLDSGEMSQQQYENLRQQANRIMGTNY